MTEPDFDPEAVIAELLTGEVDVDVPEGAALLKRSGYSRAEFDALREVSASLEFRGVAGRAARPGSPSGDGLEVNPVAILRRAASESEAEPTSLDRGDPDRSPPRRSWLRLVPALAAAVAALFLGLVLLRGGGEQDWRGPAREGDLATLRGRRDARELPVFVVRLSAVPPTLTIPQELVQGWNGGLAFVLEEEIGRDRWETVDELESDGVTLELPLAWAAALADPSSPVRVRWDYGPSSSSRSWSEASLSIR